MRNSIFIVILFFVFVFQPSISWAGELPRYGSVRANEANIRTGPGGKYPIRWVLTRKNMPVKIIRDFDGWRQIEIFDGDTKGWIHKNLLSGKKTAIIIEDVQELHKKPETDSSILLRLEPGVIVELDHCAKAWCSVEVSGYEGWVTATGLWGGTK